VSVAKQALALRVAKAFVLFWWDFLIGDTPELFVGTILLLGVTALTSLVGHLRVLSVIALPLGAALMLLASVLRAIKAKRSS